MTFPPAEGQIPIYYNFKNTGRPSLNDNDKVYRSAYLDVSNTPRFPFGYGLSYTTFKLSDLKLSSNTIKSKGTIKVSLEIQNVGNKLGEEVVQLYLQDKVASVTRPLKELKDFEKVLLKAGERKEISFIIDEETLRFYDKDMTWTSEPGEFKVMIGNSSENILLESIFTLEE